MDGGIYPRGKKRKVEELPLKLDDDTIKRLVIISKEQKFQLKRLQRELKNAYLLTFVYMPLNFEKLPAAMQSGMQVIMNKAYENHPSI